MDEGRVLLGNIEYHLFNAIILATLLVVGNHAQKHGFF